MTIGRLGTVFLSHSAREPDHAVTCALAEALTEVGLDVWWDRDGLEGGDFFPVEILEAIIRQRCFLFIVSPRSVASRWCLRELVRATDLGKETIPLILEPVADELLPLQLAGLQYVHISTGVADALPGILRALGLGPSSAAIREDPFSRDGRLIAAIAEQLHYAAGFTDTLNMVQILQNVGLACCETERARAIFQGMRDLQHFSPGGGVRKIDYGKVRAHLLGTWAS
jgi:hypothetical protein